MKRLIPLGALLLVTALMFSACGASKVHSVATNPQAKQDLAKGEAIVKACLTKGNILSKDGRKAIFGCIAPPGQEKVIEQCAEKAVKNDGFLRKKQRKKLYQDLAICAEAHR